MTRSFLSRFNTIYAHEHVTTLSRVDRFCFHSKQAFMEALVLFGINARQICSAAHKQTKQTESKQIK